MVAVIRKSQPLPIWNQLVVPDISPISTQILNGMVIVADILALVQNTTHIITHIFQYIVSCAKYKEAVAAGHYQSANGDQFVFDIFNQLSEISSI